MLYKDLYEDQEVLITLVDGRVLNAYIGRDDQSFLDIELNGGNLGFIDKRYNTVTVFDGGVIDLQSKIVEIRNIN